MSTFLNYGLLNRLQTSESSMTTILVEAAMKVCALHDLDAFFMIDLPVGRVWAGQKQLREDFLNGGLQPRADDTEYDIDPHVLALTKRATQPTTPQPAKVRKTASRRRLTAPELVESLLGPSEEVLKSSVPKRKGDEMYEGGGQEVISGVSMNDGREAVVKSEFASVVKSEPAIAGLPQTHSASAGATGLTSAAVSVKPDLSIIAPKPASLVPSSTGISTGKFLGASSTSAFKSTQCGLVGNALRPAGVVAARGVSPFPVKAGIGRGVVNRSMTRPAIGVAGFKGNLGRQAASNRGGVGVRVGTTAGFGGSVGGGVVSNIAMGRGAVGGTAGVGSIVGANVGIGLNRSLGFQKNGVGASSGVILTTNSGGFSTVSSLTGSVKSGACTSFAGSNPGASNSYVSSLPPGVTVISASSASTAHFKAVKLDASSSGAIFTSGSVDQRNVSTRTCHQRLPPQSQSQISQSQQPQPQQLSTQAAVSESTDPLPSLEEALKDADEALEELKDTSFESYLVELGGERRASGSGDGTISSPIQLTLGSQGVIEGRDPETTKAIQGILDCHPSPISAPEDSPQHHDADDFFADFKTTASSSEDFFASLTTPSAVSEVLPPTTSSTSTLPLNCNVPNLSIDTITSNRTDNVTASNLSITNFSTDLTNGTSAGALFSPTPSATNSAPSNVVNKNLLDGQLESLLKSTTTPTSLDVTRLLSDIKATFTTTSASPGPSSSSSGPLPLSIQQVLSSLKTTLAHQGLFAPVSGAAVGPMPQQQQVPTVIIEPPSSFCDGGVTVVSSRDSASGMSSSTASKSVTGPPKPFLPAPLAYPGPNANFVGTSTSSQTKSQNVNSSNVGMLPLPAPIPFLAAINGAAAALNASANVSGVSGGGVSNPLANAALLNTLVNNINNIVNNGVPGAPSLASAGGSLGSNLVPNAARINIPLSERSGVSGSLTNTPTTTVTTSAVPFACNLDVVSKTDVSAVVNGTEESESDAGLVTVPTSLSSSILPGTIEENEGNDDAPKIGTVSTDAVKMDLDILGDHSDEAGSLSPTKSLAASTTPSPPPGSSIVTTVAVTSCLNGQVDSRKRASVFSAHQIEVLASAYSLSKYPTFEKKRELATKLGLTDMQVKNWFHTRRKKDKKHLGQ